MDKAATAAEDSDRMRKVLESKANGDEGRMIKLEEELKGVRTEADNCDNKYEEVQRRLQKVEGELERTEEQADVSEEKANQRESSYKKNIFLKIETS